MANTTNTEIANKILFLLKIDTEIADLDTDTTTNGKLIKKLFYDSLDSLLESYPWNFAVARASLSPAVTTPEYEYTNMFLQPVEPYCLRVLEVVDSSAYIVDDWVIEGRHILTNVSPIKIKYTKRVTVYGELSPLFREAFAYYVASQIAEPLTRSTQLKLDMVENFDKFLKKAIRADARQGTVKARPSSVYTWFSSRYGGSGGRAGKNYG